jgi:DNA modification methylase
MNESFAVSNLKGDPKNPRTITKIEYDKLKELLDKFGDLSGVIRNVQTNELVGGHMRTKAFIDSSAQSNVQITQRFETPTKAGTIAVGYVIVNGEMFSYREVDWTMGMQKAANLAANKAGGSFDKDMLAETMYDISQLEGGADLLGLTAFDDKEISKLLDSVGVGDDPDEDNTPPVDDVNPAVSKLGEIYQLGSHRLMCGDSTSESHIAALMNGNVADLVFTDPPYGVSYQSNMRTESAKFDVIKNDDVLITEWIKPTLAVSSGWVFIWTSWKVLREWLEITEPIGDMSNMIIWDKGGGGIGDLTGTFASDYEVALVFNRGGKIAGDRLGSVWSVGKDAPGKYEHPTQKPIALAEMALRSTTMRDDKVLDVFGGSGFTMLAAEKLGRQSFTMELDPRYVDVIRKRYAKHINQEDWQAVTPAVERVDLSINQDTTPTIDQESFAPPELPPEL